MHLLTTGATMALGLTLLTAPPAQAQSGSPIADPLPEPIVSGLSLTLEEFATFPKSEPVPAPTDPRLDRHARINYLGQLPDRSGRLYVPDLNGKLYFIDRGTVHEYLDVGARYAPDFWNHRGLGSGFGFAAFHPQFARNGRFYTVHTEARDALAKTPDLPAQPNSVVHGVLTEWIAEDPSANSFTGTSREMLRLAFGTFIHGYQEIGFDPTAKPWDRDYGLLYVSVGDGGRGRTSPDPQDLAMPHGKILRIDPLGTDGVTGEYGIPPSNPFVGTPGALGEIYAYGLRNPHRFSWDAHAGHRMFVGNIGEHVIESVYEVRAGDNFGWPHREGPFLYKPEDRCNVYPLPDNDSEFGYTYPVVAYDHDPPPGWPCGRDTGDAVIGGFVYRGHRLPALYGKYVFGDDVNGRLFYTHAHQMRRGADLATMYEFTLLDAAGRRVTMQDLAGHQRVDLRFGTDRAGEIYVLSKANGKIWKIAGARWFAGCRPAGTTVKNVMAARHWSPVTPSKWRFPGHEVILAEPGTARPGPRRPYEYAVLSSGPAFGSVQIDAKVRIDTPVPITNRDVIIVFGYRSDTQFYYVHLSTDNTIYPHNGIFVVNNADRLRIDHQWNGSTGAPPAIVDDQWHRVRVVHCAGTGEIAVYVDGSSTPLMTAVDTTFASGRAGFGSFDNIGRIKDLVVTGQRQSARPDVLPSLSGNLVAHYDFEHPSTGDPSEEEDQGLSGTRIKLLNGGAQMRVRDGAHRGSRMSLQTRQVDPATAGNDDWKAGVYSSEGVPSLRAFNGVAQMTIMGWFKMTGPNPSPNSNTPNPDDLFGAIGLAGVLSGNSDGHSVRALLELIQVSGTMRVVALARRVDGATSQTFAADADWQTILPQGKWVFLAATFDFDTGEMGLYRNGRPLRGFYTVPGDPWQLEGPPEPDLASPTDPRGIKIGGSFPQNTRETNPCNCRFDSLMFLDRVVTEGEMMAQYRLVTRR